jgi:hypothetical protein
MSSISLYKNILKPRVHVVNNAKIKAKIIKIVIVNRNLGPISAGTHPLRLS